MTNPFVRFARGTLAATALALCPAWAQADVLAPPNDGGVYALTNAMTGVYYSENLGFTGGTPFTNEWDDAYFALEVVDGALPDGMWIDEYWDDASYICLCGSPDDDAVGDYSFTVQIADAAGANVEQAFTLTVDENPNHAPVIDFDSTSPNTDTIRLEPGDSQTFTVVASDPDGGELTYTWWARNQETYEYLPGWDEKVAGASVEIPFADEGSYWISVLIRDDERYVTHGWWVRVKAVTPLAAPDADGVIALPDATTGVEYWDEDNDDCVRLGFTGGAPILFYDDEWDEYYSCFDYTVVKGALPEGLYVAGRYGDDASSIYLDGAPDDDAAGEYSFTIRIDGANGESAEQAFTLTVAENPNHKPVIDSYSPDSYIVYLEPGESQTFSVTASDPDGDGLTFTWDVYDENDNDVPGYDGVLGSSIVFSSNAEGWYYVSVAVSDGERSVWQGWEVRVKAPTPLAAPKDEVVALPDAMAGEYYYDKDNDDPFYLGFTGGTPLFDEWNYPYFEIKVTDGKRPDGMWIGGYWDDASYIDLYGYPEEPGDYAFTVQVTDATGASVEQAFTLTVGGNRRPVFTNATPDPEAGDVIVPAGESVTFEVAASDPEGEPLTFEWYLDNEVLAATGSSWTYVREAGDAASHAVHVWCYDGERWSKDPVSWEVWAHQAPVFTSATPDPEAGDVIVPVGGSVTFEVAASDPEGEPLTFQWWLDGEELAETGSSWTYVREAGDAASHAVSVRCYDGDRWSKDTLAWEVWTHRAPVVTAVTPDPEAETTLYVGKLAEFAVTASDPEGEPLAFEWELDDAALDAAGPSWAWTPTDEDADASHAIRVRCTDGDRWTDWTVWIVDVVVEPPPAPAPPAPTTYTVAFKANGGTGTMADQTFTKDVAAKLAANKFTKNGYVFMGWAKTATGAVAYADGASVKNLAAAGGSATLYAQWAVKTYTVKFNANGGTSSKKMKAVKVTYGTSKKLTKNKFTRKGYVFAGWATSQKNAKKGIIAFTNAEKVSNLRTDGKTTTLYAVWAKPTYKVRFFANGGKGSMDDQTFKYGKAKKLKANKFKAPKGKKFAGWATSKKNAKKGQVAYKNKKSVKNLVITGKTVKLYAVWKKK